MLNNQAQEGQQKRVHPLDFFRPDQIVFLVTHDVTINAPLPEGTLSDWVASLSLQISQNEVLSNKSAQEFVAELCDDEQLPQEILNDWMDNFREQLKEIKVKGKVWELADTPARSYSFPSVSSDQIEGVPSEYQFEEQFAGTFSIIVCNVKNDPDRVKARRDLLDFISELNRENIRPGLRSAGLTMQGVFPNWLASSGASDKPKPKSDGGGTGGPGSVPVPYDGLPGQVSYYFKDLIDKLQVKDLEGKDLYGEGGKGVDVVILDTAPSGHDLVLAHKELVLVPEQNNQIGHPLIKTLLGMEGKLKLYPASYNALLRMGNTSLNKQGYQMADHGLFVAGIVHSIAPEATIHLVEVLNQFGVGDFETIARGLARAYGIARRNKRPLVVNCSLVFDLPDHQKKYIYQPTDMELITKSDREIEEDLRNKIDSELTELKLTYGEEKAIDKLEWVGAIMVMCERLARAGRQVIAAAGNEANEAGESRQAPDARYPAAFGRVIGIGALPKDAERTDGSGTYNASSFSNLADKPSKNGVMALGGEPGAENGVLGIYLGNFPVLVDDEDDNDATTEESGWDKLGPRSEKGWAWWAGTSFATPILTGTIAAVLGSLQNQRSTQHAVAELYTRGVIVNSKTDAQEDVMPLSLTQVVKPPS